MEQSREIQEPSDDRITREIQRISDLSFDRLMSEVVQMAYHSCLIKTFVESTKQSLVELTKQGAVL